MGMRIEPFGIDHFLIELVLGKAFQTIHSITQRFDYCILAIAQEVLYYHLIFFRSKGTSTVYQKPVWFQSIKTRYYHFFLSITAGFQIRQIATFLSRIIFHNKPFTGTWRVK